MKLELCSFSGYKIHPGHGRFFVRTDGRQLFFLNHKVNSLYFQRKNPRKIAWTVLYRRKRRKGIAEEAAKRKTRRTQKFQRTIEGISEEKLRELRTQKPEVRAAARAQASRTAKEKSKAAVAAKKSAKSSDAKKGGAAKPAMQPVKQKAAKTVAKSGR